MKVSIGIPAYNESQNIRKLLNSIIEQRVGDFVIIEIIVITDGCSDDTEDIVKSFSSRGVRLVSNLDRKGKTFRLNQLFKLFTGDILVLFDADVLPVNKEVLINMVSPFQDQNIFLVAGRPIPKPDSSYFYKVMGVSFYLQEYVKDNYKNGNSVYSCHGRILALHRNLAKSVNINANIGNDAFIYFSNRKLEGGFYFNKSAQVYFKLPGKPADFIKQRVRFNSSSKQMREFFGSLINEYKIPRTLIINAFFKAFIKFHIYFFEYLFLVVYSNLLKKDVSPKKSFWEVSDSTKAIN
jgi:biofilm PGA synthesis N-glycosyltransferase PgaC